MEHNAGVAPVECLLFIRRTHHAKEHTVNTNRSLDYIGDIAFIEFRVEILDFLTREFLMLGKVEIGA